MTEVVILLGVLIMSVVIHENAHGWVALALGDTTAKSQGRLTLNPVKHLDPVGSVIMPLFMAVTTHHAFGYAKPVPISPQQLKGKDRGGFALVAVAGPISNFLLAVVGVLVFNRLHDQAGLTAQIARAVVEVNIFLAAFNLMPIPPLDGSRLLRLFLHPKGIQRLDKIEPYGFLIILLLIATPLGQPFFKVVLGVANVLVGLLPR